jgi:hypothetical protein
VLDQQQSSGAVARDVVEDVPALVTFGPVGARGGIRVLLTLDGQADECGDEDADLGGLHAGKTTQFGDLEFGVIIPVDGEGVEHADGIVLA